MADKVYFLNTIGRIIKMHYKFSTLLQSCAVCVLAIVCGAVMTYTE